jgi:hypothetical protein
MFIEYKLGGKNSGHNRLFFSQILATLSQPEGYYIVPEFFGLV